MDLSVFKNKKVLVMGLGLHGGGEAATKFFLRLGAKVTVTDLKTALALKKPLAGLKRFRNITYHLGGHRARDFRAADYVIKNPGVPDNSPFLEIARRVKVPILSDVEIFFLASPAPIIGITGTKGKSTVATLLGQFLKAAKKPVWVAGNIRKSVLDILPKVRAKGVVVLELSSFQLDSLRSSRLSPNVALMTNIFPDHLNRYPNMSAYIASKCGIFKFQKYGDHVFVNARDRLLRRLVKNAPSRIMLFDVRDLDPFKKVIKPSIPPYHLANIAAAVAVARHMGVRDNVIRKVLAKFSGVPGRMELVKIIRGIEFINDTTATNPIASKEAIVAVKKRIGRRKLHLIAGGYDKCLPLKDFIAAAAKSTATVIFLPGTATKKMAAQLARLRPPKPRIYNAETMAAAVKTAFRHTARGDVILLSPGAASFGLFKHEFDRGDKFVKAVKNLKAVD